MYEGLWKGGQLQTPSSRTCCRCDGVVHAMLRLASSRQAPRTLVISNVLKPWQIQRLQEASAKGRRNISVRELCGDLQLQRADVLQWLKDHQRATEQHSRSPQEAGSVEEGDFSWGSGDEQRHTGFTGSGSQPRKMQKQHLRTPKELPDSPRRAPWAQSYGMKKLPKAAELTLEKVYSEWTHPPSAIIDSLWDLHQIPRRRALDWFAKRRVSEAQGP